MSSSRRDDEILIKRLTVAILAEGGGHWQSPTEKVSGTVSVADESSQIGSSGDQDPRACTDSGTAGLAPGASISWPFHGDYDLDQGGMWDLNLSLLYEWNIFPGMGEPPYQVQGVAPPANNYLTWDYNKYPFDYDADMNALPDPNNSQYGIF
ncbi:hypothetical protein AX15_001259 [Amanita polypyramis BW_CC]|nr:hypothetical protein AX15_001259 [Amanita polypyramis BW_CC]